MYSIGIGATFRVQPERKSGVLDEEVLGDEGLASRLRELPPTRGFQDGASAGVLPLRQSDEEPNLDCVVAGHRSTTAYGSVASTAETRRTSSIRFNSA